MIDPMDDTGRSKAYRATVEAETPSRRSAYRRIHVWGSICLYLASLALPGFDSGGAVGTSGGILILLLGWLAALDGHFAWYANPLYLVALVRTPRLKASLILSGSALIVALSFLFYDTIRMSGSGPSHIELRVGYFVWIASIALYCGGQIWAGWGASTMKPDGGDADRCGGVARDYRISRLLVRVIRMPSSVAAGNSYD